MSQSTTAPNDDATPNDAAVPDLDTYRATARRWLHDNVERRDRPFEHHEIGYYTPAVMAASRALQRRLYEGGYAGISFPKEYGGQGLPSSYEAAFDEVAHDFVLPDFGVLTGMTFHVCGPTIVAHGQPAFLAEFIPKVLAGEILICQFFSEPSGGSDLAGARTRATRDGDEWVLNGQKIWSTFAHLADWGLCLARSDWEQPKHRGLTWFAVPCRSPGLTIRPIRQINNTWEFCEDFFDDVAVPDLYRIGEVNEGWTVAQTMLVRERGGGSLVDPEAQLHPGPLAPDLVALAQRANSTEDHHVRQKLARAHTNDFVQVALGARLAELGRLGRLDAGAAAYGKLFMGLYDPIRARLGLEIGGADALAWDPADDEGAATSLSYLNGRIVSIAGGSNEMQRNAISERQLGLPREPSYDTNKPFNQVLRDAAHWGKKP